MAIALLMSFKESRLNVQRQLHTLGMMVEVAYFVVLTHQVKSGYLLREIVVIQGMFMPTLNSAN